MKGSGKFLTAVVAELLSQRFMLAAKQANRKQLGLK